MDGVVLRQWLEKRELPYRVMLSLATYETYTPEDERMRMEDFIKQREGKLSGGVSEIDKDLLGNAMVESARQLSGSGKSAKQSKPKKPPTLSQGKGGRAKGKKQRGGGKGKRTKKVGAEAKQQQSELIALTKRMIEEKNTS